MSKAREKSGSDWNGTALSILLPLTDIFSRLVAWYCQEGMRFWPPFDGTRFDTIRALTDTMRPNRVVGTWGQRTWGQVLQAYIACSAGFRSSARLTARLIVLV
jgi:hypothetical protein